MCVFCQCFFFEWVSIAAFMQVQSAFSASFETHAVLDVTNNLNFKGPCTFVWVFILLYLYHGLLIPWNSFILTKSSWTASISFLILILISDFPGILNPERLCSIFISAWVAFSDISSLLAPSNSKLLFFEKSVDHNIRATDVFSSSCLLSVLEPVNPMEPTEESTEEPIPEGKFLIICTTSNFMWTGNIFRCVLHNPPSSSAYVPRYFLSSLSPTNRLTLKIVIYA